MTRTAFLYHPLFLEHETGPLHPERRQRLEAIVERLQVTGILDRCIMPEPIEAPIETIARIHAPAYIEHIAAQSSLGRHFNEDSETVGSSATYRAALLAAGAVRQAADLVMKGAAANAFCAVRPPGHHAEREKAMGFCFFNNVAVAARHLQDQYGMKRVAIIDWDVHHGNGTQNAFNDDPSVFYFSIHQYPHYPGSGRRDETGTGLGKGFTLNVPVSAGSTDTDYLQAFNELLVPAMNRFKPEFYLLSAGFDAHEDDPLSSVMVSTPGFAAMTRLVKEMAARHCEGRLVSVLEGGYDLASLASSVATHMNVLMENEHAPAGY